MSWGRVLNTPGRWCVQWEAGWQVVGKGCTGLCLDWMDLPDQPFKLQVLVCGLGGVRQGLLGALP